MGSSGTSNSSSKPIPIQRLSNVLTTRILPAAPREPSYMELSNLDQLVVPYHTPVLLFYKPTECGGSSFSQILHTLKRSLSEVLTTFYPMAGQLENTGAEAYHPRLLCDGSGAVFTEASISLELDDLIHHDHFEPSALLSGMDTARVDPRPNYKPFSVPVLIIQATCFQCGGVAIGVNWHHSVADGISGTHFMKSWAEVARGEKISLLPCHNRALVKAREPAPHPVMDVDNVICLERPAVSQEGTEQDKASNSTKLFLWREKKVSELKTEASMGSSESRFTSLDCVSAHLWRCFTKARGLRGEDVTAFVTIADVRNKMDPPLPQGYFGNAVDLIWARTTAGELLSGPLSAGAGLIRDAICGVTGETLQALIDWKERRLERTTVVGVPSVEGGHQFGISSWKHFCHYDLDFTLVSGGPCLLCGMASPLPLPRASRIGCPALMEEEEQPFRSISTHTQWPTFKLILPSPKASMWLIVHVILVRFLCYIVVLFLLSAFNVTCYDGSSYHDKVPWEQSLEENGWL